MSTNYGKDISAFVEATIQGRQDAMAWAVRLAYASGAEVADLLSAVDRARVEVSLSPLVVEQARATVCAWQWIADRRRAYA
jgi:hypothetical protein